MNRWSRTQRVTWWGLILPPAAPLTVLAAIEIAQRFQIPMHIHSLAGAVALISSVLTFILWGAIQLVSLIVALREFKCSREFRDARVLIGMAVAALSFVVWLWFLARELRLEAGV